MNDLNSSLTILSVVFWAAFVVSAIFAYPIYKLLLAVKSRQIVSQYVQEHLKKQGTPTMGGLILVPGFIAACALAKVIGLIKGPVLLVAMCLFGGYALIGLLDDFIVPRLLKGKRGLGWKQKLLMEILFAGGAALWLRQWHFGYGVLLTVFLILFFSNAYNFADGMDGMAGSILIVFAGGLAALAMLEMRPDVYGVLAVALVGSVIPFLLLNMPPAKIFMGDVGALPIGALLGFLVDDLLRPGIVGLSNQSAMIHGFSGKPVATMLQHAIPLLIMSVVLIVELVPVPLQVASVKLRKKRLFPMTPIHHAFEKAGWPESRVVWMFVLTQLLLVALGLTVAVANPTVSP